MGRVRAATPAKAVAPDAADWYFASSPDAVLVLNGPLIERVNPAWTRLTGWSADETVGRRVATFSHPENSAAIDAATDKLAAEGFAETELRIPSRDGRTLWVSCRFWAGPDGQVLAVLRDIGEERLRAAKDRRLRDAVNLLNDISGVSIWRFDPDQRLYFIDEHLDRQSVDGSAGSAVFGTREMGDEIHPDDGAILWEAFKHTLQTGETRVVRYRTRQVDKDWGYEKATMRGLRRLASGKWEVLGMSQNVNELVLARDAAMRGEQAAKDAAESKSQFLANMSHEIRTPLNGVMGVLHLLKNEPLSDEGRGLLAEALSCGSMLADLLNDVLDFSKIEAGCLELQYEPTDVTTLVDGVTSILRSQAQAKGLGLEVEVAAGVGWVRTDPVRLRQMLFNLVGNALKFTTAGRVAVRLTLEGEGAGRRLRFEVADTGIGLSAETQAKLFTRFYQADGSMTRGQGGTGLGLAITKHLAQLMGGDVGVESREGVGSTFWIDIPGSQIAAPAIQSFEETAWLKGLRILVVEDNAINRLIVTKILENLGAAVETAENGALGVEAAQRCDFDLIFMDIQMPVMDGVAATRAIRAMAGQARLVPIIAMTANVMAHQREAYQLAGMDGAIAKPLSPAAIIAEITKLAEAGPQSESAAAEGAGEADSAAH